MARYSRWTPASVSIVPLMLIGLSHLSLLSGEE
jgi:hypothetical protein